jgi:hypothetical protein
MVRKDVGGEHIFILLLKILVTHIPRRRRGEPMCSPVCHPHVIVPIRSSPIRNSNVIDSTRQQVRAWVIIQKMTYGGKHIFKFKLMYGEEINTGRTQRTKYRKDDAG